jgi:hypothetical protein
MQDPVTDPSEQFYGYGSDTVEFPRITRLPIPSTVTLRNIRYTVMDGSLKHPRSLKHSMKSLSVPKLSLHKYLTVLATYIHTKINQNLREI